MFTHLKKVTTFNGGDDHKTIIQRCKDIAVSTAEHGLTNDFALYKQVLSCLSMNQNFKIVALKDLQKQSSSQYVTIALRHDIDADIVTAILCARAIEEYGLTGSFYPLHTSHYYTIQPSSDSSQIIRHTGLEYLLTALNTSNIEIGLHNDAIGLALDHGIDGASVLKEEITWLRSIGLDIKGTVAHNSAAVYNSECFEIFKSLSVGQREYVEKDGKKIALGILDQHKLGLEYEGNFPIPKKRLDVNLLNQITNITGNPLHTPDWQHSYFINHPVFERNYEYDIWLVGEDLWLLAGDKEVFFPMKTAQMLEALSNIPKGSKVVISIHPIYVSNHTMTI